MQGEGRTQQGGPPFEDDKGAADVGSAGRDDQKPQAEAQGAPDLKAAAQAIEAFLRALGHNPLTEPELGQTGRLVAEAFQNDFLSGYRMDPAALLAETIDSDDSELVVVRDIATVCMCPHHLMPAQGVVHVGYVPDGRIVGLGALGRVVDCFARRLVLQETLAHQVAQAIVEHLGARAAGCVADLSPACMTARGERRHGARSLSVATAGSMRADPGLRNAFLALCAPGAAANPAPEGTQ